MEASGVVLEPEPDRGGGRTRPPAARASATALGAPAAYAAELLGTFALVFFVCMVVSVNSGDGLGFTDFTVIGLVHAFVLMLLIHSLGGASGAHFNPAVTLALLAGRKIRGNEAAVYIVVQLIGAVLGALLCKLLLSDEGDAVNYGATTIAEAPEPAAPTVPGQPPADTGPGWLDGKPLGGLVVEALGTFFLMWSIMAMAVNPRGARDWAPFVIGSTLALAVMVFAPLTGAGLNPARSFGPALVSGEFADFWVYVVGPVLGAVLAYAAYTAIVLNPQDRAGERPIDKLD